MNVPLVDLTAEYASIRPELDEAILAVASSGRYVLGPNVSALEAEIARFVGVKHAVGVASGTDALIIALRAAGVQAGDEVIVPAFSFLATATAVMLIGARPVFVDIEPGTYLLDAARIEAAVTPRARAIIPVHLFGHPADMRAIEEAAAQHNLAIIEDNAQAIGAEWQGRRTGSFGRAGCLSFYPGKNLGALGDAGMITTDDEGLAQAARMLRTHGWRKKYFAEVVGYNSRLDELQAAALLVKLRHLAGWTRRRREIAQRYTAELRGSDLDLPVELPGCTHVFYRYMLGFQDRDTVREHLAAAGIATEVYFPQPLHLVAACRSLGGREGDFPVAEAASRSLLAIPLYPQLSDEQIDYVCREVRRASTPAR